MENIETFIILVIVIVGVVGIVFKFSLNKNNSNNKNSNNLSNSDSNINIIGDNNTVVSESPEIKTQSTQKILNKGNLQILFIDDEDFVLIKVIKNGGWKNITKIKDVDDFDDVKIKNADVIFVDILGVGKKLQFKYEGLGLALELKKYYPEKCIGIYSSTNKHDIFLDLDKLDFRLPKNAEPIQYFQVLKNYVNKRNEN